MNAIFENLIVLAVVAAAVAYLARVAWQTVARRRAAACGGCENCPSASANNAPRVVEIGSLTSSVSSAQHTNGAAR